MAASAVDVRLIDPTEVELADALRRAHAAANRGVLVNGPQLARNGDFWLRFARDCRREPEGRRRSCRAGQQTPEVVAGWWTDPASRKHFRVLGRTRHRGFPYMRPMRREGELRGLPPWWHVYPEAVLAVRRADGGENYLACCRCGAVGTPESLGWMGDTCGPCFDRRADGGDTVRGFGHFTGWTGNQGHARVAFSADSASLVGPVLPNKFRAVRLADGAEVQCRGAQGPVMSVVETAGAYLFALVDGSVYRWEHGSPVAVRVLARATMYGRPMLDPTGRRAVVMSLFTGFTADLTAARPRYADFRIAHNYGAMRFNSSGDTLFGVTNEGALTAIDPATMAERVVRAGVFGGLARYGYALDLTIAPDNSAVAVLRQLSNSNSLVIRLIPLATDGPMLDFRLPEWHRPTSLEFAPDGQHLATLEAEAGWVGFWRLPSWKSLGFVRAVPEDPAWRSGPIQFSPDGRAIAVLYCGIHQDRGSTVAVWPWPDVARAAGGT